MADTVTVVPAPPQTVVVDDTGGAQIITQLIPGPIGKQGDPGIQGPKGDPGAGTNIQISKTNEDVVTATFGQPVSLIHAGQFVLASASDASKDNVFGLVADPSIAVGASGLIQVQGLLIASSTSQWDAITGMVGGLVEGATYFLSPTTGQITNTPPSTPGQFLVKLGKALNSTELYIEIGNSILL